MPPSSSSDCNNGTGVAAASGRRTGTVTSPPPPPPSRPNKLGTMYRHEVLDFRVEIEFVVNPKTDKRRFYPGIIKEVNLRRQNGRLVAKHLVLFEDGEDHWMDLTDQHRRGLVRWPKYYTSNANSQPHPPEVYQPATNKMTKGWKKHCCLDVQNKSCDGTGAGMFECEQHQAQAAQDDTNNQVYQVVVPKSASRKSSSFSKKKRRDVDPSSCSSSSKKKPRRDSDNDPSYKDSNYNRGIRKQVEHSDEGTAKSSVKSFEERVQEYVDFKREHGKAWIAKSPHEHSSLATWCSEQRTKYKRLQSYNRTGKDQAFGFRKMLTRDQVQKLEAVGFPWTTPPDNNLVFGNKRELAKVARWEEGLRAYIDFRRKHRGKIWITKGKHKYRSLAQWCCDQRTGYNLLNSQKAGEERTRKDNRFCLTQEQVEKLTTVGFPWEKPEDNAKIYGCHKRGDIWEESLQKYINFSRKYGTPWLTKNAAGGIGQWCCNQRTRARVARGTSDVDQLHCHKNESTNWRPLDFCGRNLEMRL